MVVLPCQLKQLEQYKKMNHAKSNSICGEMQIVNYFTAL